MVDMKMVQLQLMRVIEKHHTWLVGFIAWSSLTHKRHQHPDGFSFIWKIGFGALHMVRTEQRQFAWYSRGLWLPVSSPDDYCTSALQSWRSKERAIKDDQFKDELR